MYCPVLASCTRRLLWSIESVLQLRLSVMAVAKVMLGRSLLVMLNPPSLREAPNGGVDAAARIKAPSAAPSKLRNTLPPLASNDLFDVPSKCCTQRTLFL